jgi:hypothetical protein
VLEFSGRLSCTEVADGMASWSAIYLGKLLAGLESRINIWLLDVVLGQCKRLACDLIANLYKPNALLTLF